MKPTWPLILAAWALWVGAAPIGAAPPLVPALSQPQSVTSPAAAAPVGLNALTPPPGVAACKGDGVTNDLPALQAQADFCNINHRPLDLPSGTYKVNGTWNLMKLMGGYHTGLVVRAISQRGGQSGPGGGVTLLEGIPNQKAVVEIGPQACIANRWDGITIDGGPSSFNTQYGLWVRFANWSQWLLLDCAVQNTRCGISLPSSAITGLGSGAAATAVINGAGQVTALTPTAGGSGYSQEFPPYVVLPAPPGGGDAFFTATVSAGGQVTGYTQVSPGHGYTSVPPVILLNAGGGHGEEMNFVHCGISGSEIGLESATDADQNFGLRLYGCFGGVGLGGVLFQLGVGYSGQMSIHGGDFTLQHDDTHRSTFLRTPGFGTFYAGDVRMENCDTFLDEQGGSGGTKITLQSAVLTNSDGPFIKGGANGGETTLTLRDCQVFASDATKTALNWQLGKNEWHFDKYIFDGTDFSYKDVSALLGNPHVTLRDCRLSNGVTTYPGNRPLPNQSATY